MKPLEGTTVLDLTRMLPGALATMTLARFGADVLKIEAPGGGDSGRSMGPGLAGQSAWFQFSNSGKRSMVLNLKHPRGAEIFRALAEKTDIVIESFRPGVMQRLGLGYEQLAERNPKLVYVALSGYGQEGPYAAKPGHDLNYLALSGILEALGTGTNVPAVQIADFAAALQCVIGALLALRVRDKTGRGQLVDVSILESALPLLTVPLAEHASTDSLQGRGTLAGQYACYNLYQARDGRRLALGALEPKFWAAFCRMIQHERFIDKQFTEPDQPEMIGQVAKVMKQKSAAEWLGIFEGVDTCLTPVNGIADMIGDRQLQARQILAPVEGLSAATHQVGALPKLQSTPGEVGGPPPALGEHTREVLSDLGYAEQEIVQMVRGKIVEVAASR